MKRVRRNIKSAVRKCLMGMLKSYIKYTDRISKTFGYRLLLDDYMKVMCKEYEHNTDYYLTYKYREKRADLIHSIEQENKTDKMAGIIIQGPLVLENHFTLETVRIYKKLFPSCQVIVSTWENENVRELEALSKEQNCILLKNSVPSDPGILNVNLQCVSTLAGIQKAKELGCKYIAKTRTDWRMYEKGAIRFMVHLLEEFPCRNTLFEQNSRIITMDIATDETAVMFYPFWLSDIFQFGEVMDMERYWSHAASSQGRFSKQGLNNLIRTEKYTWKRRVEEGLLIEARLSSDYYRRMSNIKPEISVDASWNFIRDYFMIVPRSLTGGYWYKYESRRYNESEDWGTCFKNDTDDDLLTYNFDFVSWLNLYFDDLDYPDQYKKMCERRRYEYK